MEDLLKVFEIRDADFNEQTFKIFKLIDTTLVCVTSFLSVVDPMCATGTITWEDATLSDDLVVLVGVVDQQPGAVIKTEGGESSITKDNAQYFQRVVHMSLPFDLVKESNKGAITEFLYAIHAENKADEAAKMLKTGVGVTEFDLSDLTNEQRTALQMFDNKEKN